MIKYVFGPVASRRLGISLGVDIIPYKTCTLDCIYCECGRTTDLTLQRQRFVDPGVVLEEVEEILSQEKTIDYITFSGSGEPTLNSDIGHFIRGIRAMTSIPIAVLTNGTLLHLEEVRDELAQAHLVLPSLDAVTPGVFAGINRPHPALDIDTVIRGLAAFRAQFKGQIWLEVFIAKGINDSEAELAHLYRTINEIRPDRVQLNSLDRPPAVEDVQAVSLETLETIKKKWRGLTVQIIKRIRKREEIAAFSNNLENNILNTIKRRPLTIDDLEILTNKKRLELFKYIDVLEREKRIFPRIVEGKVFYSPTPSARKPRQKMRKKISREGTPIDNRRKKWRFGG
jgi:wyosine [tRNA(Phe)-imidazoG37] synthetase (radical SAM superfamily)